MDWLEFELWDAVVNGPRRCGRLQITLDHIAQLARAPFRSCRGWIVLDDDEEETLLPMDKWKKSLHSVEAGHEPEPPLNFNTAQDAPRGSHSHKGNESQTVFGKRAAPISASRPINFPARTDADAADSVPLAQ
jgi:hypothetical protein